MNTEDLSKLLDELESRFPLASQLRFSQDDSTSQELLPPIVALLASMTNAELEGDNCALLPSKESMAAYVATLIALSAAAEHFPELLVEYASNGFSIGERVRVLPTKHVYVFGGYYREFGDFFKLNVIGSDSGESRSFPISEIVRLEKTERKIPKGRGGTRLGEYASSKLDYLIGTRTCGNDALLRNEVLLITPQSHFLEYMDHVLVSHINKPDLILKLRDVIPWGVVTAEGDIDFRESGAATGEPLIAVSSRMEYVALACKREVLKAPRVVVDGAGRIHNSLQAFDDLVDYSKLLVLADHSQIDVLPELTERNCSVWKLPDNISQLIGESPVLLREFRRAYHNASWFRLEVHTCESEGADKAAAHLFRAQQILREAGVDDEDAMKTIGVAYGRLLDVASVLQHDDSELGSIKELLATARGHLERLSAWMHPEAFTSLDTAYKYLDGCLEGSGAGCQTEKHDLLVNLLVKLSERGIQAVVVADNPIAATSARKFADENDFDVPILKTRELMSVSDKFAVLLTGWPKRRNLERIVNYYAVSEVHALAYGFESEWFSGAARRRRYQLGRWESNAEQFRRVTGLQNAIGHPAKVTMGGQKQGDLEQLFSFEDRISQIRKGSRDWSPADELREARYVSFVGVTYAWLSASHKIPVITRLIESVSAEERVPLKNVDELGAGDYVVFRRHSDRDIIRFIAERLLGEAEYEQVREVAEKWKYAVTSISDDIDLVYERLQSNGLTKTMQTVRNWLGDSEVIGPGSLGDLKVIGKAAGDKWLERSADNIWSAISRIRGVHVAAGNRLSNILATQLPAQLAGIEGEETYVELVLDDRPIGTVVIVQVEYISEEIEDVAASSINRILWSKGEDSY